MATPAPGAVLAAVAVRVLDLLGLLPWAGRWDAGGGSGGGRFTGDGGWLRSGGEIGGGEVSATAAVTAFSRLATPRLFRRHLLFLAPYALCVLIPAAAARAALRAADLLNLVPHALGVFVPAAELSCPILQASS